ncbi:MAG TPA: shikimate kinase [Terriglobales bacterium]|jgi:shikimate kinase|nr:shikimate kinase [Terriglobales bacterium]
MGADLGLTTLPDVALLVPGSAMGVRAVFLVGFMASGKSSVGQELAQRLDWDFVDLDARIESRERQTIPEIFRDSGESGFRLAETSALRDLLAESLQSNSVVALGGGAFVQERNRELLRQWPSVFLEASVSELWERSLADGIERPLRGDPEHFARLYAERLPFYRQATVVVETTGKPLASICVEIEEALQLRGTPEDAGPEVS